MRVPYALSDDLLWADRAVLGEPPRFTYTADAVTREAVRPMFRQGGRLVATAVRNNPRRPVPGTGDAYRGLDVTATRTPTGDLLVLVVNRLPTKAVTVRLAVRGFRGSGVAVVRRVTAPAFRLAGSGWYETDFKKDGDTKRNLAGKDEAPKPAAAEAKPEPAKPSPPKADGGS